MHFKLFWYTGYLKKHVYTLLQCIAQANLIYFQIYTLVNLMSSRFCFEQRKSTLKCYWKYKNAAEVQRRYRREFPSDPPTQLTISRNLKLIVQDQPWPVKQESVIESFHRSPRNLLKFWSLCVFPPPRIIWIKTDINLMRWQNSKSIYSLFKLSIGWF